MIPGYNHNVKYKERVYHVQTEDSGLQNPHVITHLFVGGNIVESRKTSYAELVGKTSLTDELVAIMQGQHKGMLKDLISGQFDAKIVQRSVNAATLNGPAPLNVDAGAQHRTSFGLPSGGEAVAKADAKPAAQAPAPAAPVVPITVPAAQPPKPTIGGPSPLAAPRPPPLPAGAPPLGAPRPPATPVTPPAQQQPMAAQASPTFGAPPPKRAGAQPLAGAPAAIARPVPPPAPVAGQPAPATADSGLVLDAEALSRAFESNNESAVDSIFGEDLISEKSLDEVILSYLADDLQKE